MRVPSATQVLDLWDGWRVADHPERAMAIVATAYPDLPIATLDVGERDRRLLTLRCRMFGDELEMSVACPSCSSDLTFTVDARELLASLESSGDGPFVGTYESWRFEYRSPTAGDMRDAAATGDHHAARQVLIDRCLLLLEHDGAVVGPSNRPDDLEAAFVQALEDRVPAAEVRFNVSCVECDYAWTCNFDITEYLWAELEQIARRIVLDVHALASAYGWTEREILTMPASRRATYIAMLP